MPRPPRAEIEHLLAQTREMVEESRVMTAAAMRAAAQTREIVERARRELSEAQEAGSREDALNPRRSPPS
ncbi:MAG TPA: hypothetical protein VGO11_00800 [Chthoniobacteraceae bacterium]|jgi:hypothetical protein|nr:hypothetical protein [Chthoniobacteraceae bacterium]